MGLVKIKNTNDGKIGFWKLSNSDDLNFAETILNSYHPNWKNYKNKNRRHQILAARLLANKLCPNQQITQNEYGKPFLIDSNDHISISNEKDVIAMYISKHPCGIDIQSINTKIVKIYHKFYNDNDSIDILDKKQLTQLWTSKEAMYKIYGIPSILFKEHLILKKESSADYYGYCTSPSITFQCKINLHSFENYLLAFTSNFKKS